MLRVLARSVTKTFNVRFLASAAGEGGAGNTLYVGNLPFTTTDDELQQTFQQYGEVLGIRLIINRQTGQSRGFGFVEMQGAEAAKAAIAALDGSNFGGRTLRVNESEDRPKDGDRPRDGPRSDSPRRSYDPRRRQQRTYDEDRY